MEVRTREPVILAEDFSALVSWYETALGWKTIQRFDEGYHYAVLEGPGGAKVGIADRKECGVEAGDRSRNGIVLQFEVDDLKAFFEEVVASGATVPKPAAFDPNGKFWFGGFADPEGNPYWCVDRNCP
ncbi:MAG: VOC family protein [Planctomycetota bacterium]